jgi:hypothetical protein
MNRSRWRAFGLLLALCFSLVAGGVAGAAPDAPPSTPDKRAGVGAGDFKTAAAGGVQFTNRNSGRCLEILYGSAAPNARAIQFNCDGIAWQWWELVPLAGGAYQIKNQHTGQCLEVLVAALHDWAAVDQLPCSATALNQRWTFSAAGGGYWLVKPVHAPNKCLEIVGALPDNYASAQQFGCTGALNQLWKIA